MGSMPTNEAAALSGTLGVRALDHTAVAVRSIRDALRLYRDLLGGEPAEYDVMPERGFRWLALRYPNGSALELLEPVGEAGFLQDFLDRRGEGVHHVTFLVADVRAAVARASAVGLRVVDEDFTTQPTWQEAFISPRSAHGTIVQLVETPLDHETRQRHWPAARYFETL